MVNLKTLETIDSHVFEDKEKRHMSIDSMNLIGNFVVAAFSNGVMSIVTKI